VEPRLQKRYRQLVFEHLRVAGKLNSGLCALPGLANGFASVQAAWRFYANNDVTLPVLVEPLQQTAQYWRKQSPSGYGLIIHDWSSLKYPGHKSKTDQACLSNGEDWGYELSTALLVDAKQGDPVAPLEMRVLTARKVYSTRQPAPKRKAFRVDEVVATMRDLAKLGLGPVVHIIDREADSLAHYRQWHADGFQFVIRADGERIVRCDDEETRLDVLGRKLWAQGRFRRSREVHYHGQRAVQKVAETTVVLDRPAWRNRRRGGKRVTERVPGVPITLRLIISYVCNERGETLAVWYLLTNAPPEITTETVALWYYWRWRIESFFKLLKSAGQQLEHWQQETGSAIAKRLLVAAMACVVVWKIQRHPAPAAADLRTLLVRLSGRQMKWGKAYTAPSLLAGLWVYLAMLETLEHYSVIQLRAMKQYLFWEPDTG
jgi:hypothetical protein